MAALAPDVILATGDSTVPPLLLATRSVPIVFPVVTDPVGAGYVDSLARPGGNVTGFMNFEYGTGGKWLELLKEIAPNTLMVGRDYTPQACPALRSQGLLNQQPLRGPDACAFERAEDCPNLHMSRAWLRPIYCRYDYHGRK